MANDWVKMRVWLRRDPKVIKMAETLAEDKAFCAWLAGPVRQPATHANDHVTRDVTRAICVTALLEVWGMARDRGKREKDDLVLKGCSIITLDEICGVPGIGHAMEVIGWAVTQGDTIVFPRFFTIDDSPEERFRTPSAERQHRYRERKKDSATGHNARYVTRDVREEKRREEKKGTPTHPIPTAQNQLPKGGLGGNGLQKGNGRAGMMPPDELDASIVRMNAAPDEFPFPVVQALKDLGAGYASRATTRGDLTPQRLASEYRRVFYDAAVTNPLGALASRLKLLPEKRRKH